MKVSKESAATVGTNIMERRSTTRCTGAFDPCACCTMLMICAKAVFSPTCVARNRNVPCCNTVPANTLAKRFFNTGVGSPVIIDSST